jgi:hypothetical protein
VKRPSGATLIVAAVLVLLVAWIASNTEWGEVQLPTPLRGEAATNPFYAAQALVEALGATSERKQSLGATSSDAIVVLSTWGWDIDRARREELERWVETGGRLVVDAALITGGDTFASWSGIERQREDDDADADLFEAREIVGPCQTLEEISYERPSDGGELAYLEACNFDYTSWLVSSRIIAWLLSSDDGDIQAARVRVGEGAVTVVNGVPFVYREMLDGDHAQILVAAADLRAGDHVVFMSEEDVSSLLELVWQYGAPVVAVTLIFIALALWRGAVRFGPVVAPRERARRSLAEQIRGTGRFTLRVGGGAALAAAARRSLHEAAARRIVGYERLPSREQVAAVARLAAVDAGALAVAMDAAAFHPADLRSALALLESARRQLISGNHWSQHARRI